MANQRREEDLEIAAAFGRRVREIRLEKGMTQEELAEAAELHPTFISNLERGYRVPTLPTVVRIACGLSVRTDELIGGLLGESWVESDG